MNHHVVLREKLRVPEASGLTRDRLERPLLAGPPTVVDLVVAPAGSGKTTLLSRVAAASGVPVGWYRITADDSTESRLVAHLAGALGGFVEMDDVTTMAELLGALDRWTGSCGLLILDDLHEIAETAAERALERFVSLRPRRLQLICGSRRTPDVNVPRIRVSGSIREIGSDDLRFRSWEVEELFASVYQEPLRPEAAAALTRRTGGWAAGLQLFHLATVGRSTSERHQAVADLGGRSKLVRSYLTRNVLADLPEERREFLLRTCTLGRLSGDACDALLGTAASHRILEELETAQLFTFTDDGGMYFRYHEVLQTHLELALVEEYGPAEARRWYSKSAGVLETLGELRSAARAYAKAGDWVAVSRLVQDTGGARIDATVVEDAHLLPASTWQDDPWLALANARRLVREGALQRAAEAYHRAKALYDEPNYQQMCRYESQVLSSWLPGSRRVETRRIQREVQHWSTYLRNSIRQSPDFSTQQRSPAGDVRMRLMHGLAAVCAGEFRLARGILESISREESADSLATISASMATAALDLIDGDAADPAWQLSTIASMAENEGLPWIARLCHGLEQIALITTQDATWRFESCMDIVRAADQMGDRWGGGLLRLAVGLAKQRAGENAAEEFLSAAVTFNDLDAPVLEMWCRLFAMRDGATDSEASQLVETSRALGAGGAHALALSMFGSASASRPRETIDSATMAARCGIRLPPPLIDQSQSAIAAAVDVVEACIPSVTITCFGGYHIALDGESATVSALRPQARWVLQILSLAPDRDHHREFLEDILWPGIDHSVACHRLQVAVSSVRGMFGQRDVLIRRRGESYRLCLPSDATVDVRDFTDGLSRAATLSARGDVPGRIAARQGALNLYTGDLLPEITGSAHIESERERLRRSAAAAAAALASDYRTLGDYEQAMITAQRSVQLDEYQDIPWLILADVHEKLGDVSSAEYVRREHARMRAELEISA
jgi:DNA-binding SARP family transcriptional activator